MEKSLHAWTTKKCPTADAYHKHPVSPVSLTVPTGDFQSQFKRQILVANWKKFPRQFH